MAALRLPLLAVAVASVLAVQGCDAVGVSTPDPVRLDRLYQGSWFASHTFGETRYDIDYTLFLDLEETATSDGATFALSSAERPLRRSTSFLQLLYATGSDEYSFDPAQFSGTRRVLPDGCDRVDLEGVLLRSPGVAAATVRFEGAQAAGDSVVTGVVTCTPALRGCSRARVTLAPSQG